MLPDPRQAREEFISAHGLHHGFQLVPSKPSDSSRERGRGSVRKDWPGQSRLRQAADELDFLQDRRQAQERDRDVPLHGLAWEGLDRQERLLLSD